MLDPYRMVVINLIAVLTVGIGLIAYSFVFPKKKVNLLYVLLLLSVLPLISILRKGSYESGDLTLHAKFASQFFDNIIQGNVIPKWMGNHCSSYGCPVYAYLFTLPYYIASIFHFIGFSFIASVKILLVIAFLTSGFGMYLWVKDELGKISGFVSAIFYLFSPYHLIDLHFRVSIGEITSMAILPFLFLFVRKLIIFKKLSYFLASALFFALLILAHQVTSLISFPLVILYSIFVWLRLKQRKYFPVFLATGSLLLGLLLSAFYWLPILAERKYTWYGNDHYIGFHPISSFLFSPNGFGLLFQGHMGEFYFNVGYTQWFIFFFSIYLLFKNRIKKTDKNFLIFLLIIFSILFISMQSFTKPVWDFLPLIKGIQFSWRLLIEISLIISIIAGLVIKSVNSKTFTIIICSLTILYTILNWGNRKTEPAITDSLIINQPLFQEQPGAVDITTPIWVDRSAEWIGTYPKSHIEILSGKASITPISRSITKHQYRIMVQEYSLIKENTYYYPGWELFVNNKRSSINYNNQDFKGVVTFYLKKGFYEVSLVFVDTTDRIVGNTISGIALLFFGLLTLYLRPIRSGLQRFFHKTA